MAYLDNIIIYLNSVKEYKEHIKWVLRKLYKENILVTVKKCEFYTRKTNFIGFIIKPGQISIDLKKIKAIINWQDLESVIGLKSFLKFYNYYHRFIVKWLKKNRTVY
jgi:ribosome-interacting GTPase 1